MLFSILENGHCINNLNLLQLWLCYFSPRWSTVPQQLKTTWDKPFIWLIYSAFHSLKTHGISSRSERWDRLFLNALHQVSPRYQTNSKEMEQTKEKEKFHPCQRISVILSKKHLALELWLQNKAFLCQRSSAQYRTVVQCHCSVSPSHKPFQILNTCVNTREPLSGLKQCYCHINKMISHYSPTGCQ